MLIRPGPRTALSDTSPPVTSSPLKTSTRSAPANAPRMAQLATASVALPSWRTARPTTTTATQKTPTRPPGYARPSPRSCAQPSSSCQPTTRPGPMRPPTTMPAERLTDATAPDTKRCAAPQCHDDRRRRRRRKVAGPVCICGRMGAWALRARSYSSNRNACESIPYHRSKCALNPLLKSRKPSSYSALLPLGSSAWLRLLERGDCRLG